MIIHLLEGSLKIQVYYCEDDVEFEDNICIEVEEDCPDDEKLLQANQVIMLPKAIRFFIPCQVIAKLMPGYQITFLQNVQCIINGCPAYIVLLLFHLHKKRFGIEMIIP